MHDPPSGPTSALDADVRRLGRGDRGAFHAVFSALWPIISTFCERALGQGDGEDAAQITITKLFAQASDYDGQRPAIAWALSIATWECRTVRTQRRRRKVDPAALDVDVLADGSANPEERAFDAELRHAADTAMQGLSPADRETILRSFDSEGPSSPKDRKQKERALSRLKALFRKLYG